MLKFKVGQAFYRVKKEPRPSQAGTGCLSLTKGLLIQLYEFYLK